MKEPCLRKGFVVGGLLEDILPPQPGQARRPDSSESLDEFWMTEAYRESLLSAGRPAPNPAVGCVLVKDGVELARGHTQAYGGWHAERHAFSRVRDRESLRGATAYVTLEPCSHHGHQPPCADLLAELPVARVVIGRADPDPRVDGRGIRRLRDAGKKVRVGQLENEITAWNFPFFLSRAAERPFFALKWAQTLDGQLADDQGRSKWITGESSRRYTHWLRQKYDAVLVGAGTLLADLPRLSARECAPIRRQPLRLVLDPRGRLLEAGAEIRDEIRKTTLNEDLPIIALIGESRDPAEYCRLYPGLGAIRLPGGDIAEMLKALGRADSGALPGKPLQSILVEGGPRLHTELVKAGLADVLHILVAPRITGGRSHRLAPGLSLAEASRFRALSSESLGEDTVIELASPASWAKASERMEARA